MGHANLSETDLSGANLKDARKRANKKNTVPLNRLTNEELADMGPNLEGATMPDGQKYADWLKDKKAAANI